MIAHQQIGALHRKKPVPLHVQLIKDILTDDTPPIRRRDRRLALVRQKAECRPTGKDCTRHFHASALRGFGATENQKNERRSAEDTCETLEGKMTHTICPERLHDDSTSRNPRAPGLRGRIPSLQETSPRLIQPHAETPIRPHADTFSQPPPVTPTPLHASATSSAEPPRAPLTQQAKPPRRRHSLHPRAAPEMQTQAP